MSSIVHRSVAFAIAWQLWTRHRWGIVASMSVLATASLLFPVLLRYVEAAPALSLSVFPLIGVFGHLMNAFLLVEETGSLTSHYPRRMFALPVATKQLVFWPMLYGAALGVALWLATALLLYRPNGFAVPVLLPALGMAAAMAALQAISWAPVDPPWLRLALTIVGGAALIVAPAGLWKLDWIGTAGATIWLGFYLLGAYALGLAGVAADRRGAVWSARFWIWSERGRRRWERSRNVERESHYRSSNEAQLAFEWNGHGTYLPGFMIVIMLIVFAIPLLGTTPRDSRMFRLPLGILFGLPMFIASTQAGVLGRLQPFWGRTRNIAAFLYIKPMTSYGFVLAKFRMAALSVLLMYTIAIIAAIAWTAFAGTKEEVSGLWSEFHSRYPGWRAFAILGLTAIMAPILTWRQATSSFALAFCGRRWLTEFVAILGICLLGVFFAIGFWLALHPEHWPLARRILPGMMICAVIGKLVAAVWAYREVMRRGLMTSSQVWSFAKLSLGVLACLVPLLALLLSGMDARADAPVPYWAMYLSLVWLAPLVRFPVATLTWEWSRHQ